MARDDDEVSEERRGWPYDPVAGPPPPPPVTPAIEGPRVALPPPSAPVFSRRAVVLLLVALAACMLLAALGVADWWVRNREMRTLLERVERAERAQLPAILGISPLLDLCEPGPGETEPDQCDTVAIRLAAERVLPRLEMTGDEVANTRLTSIHGSIRTFRDRYVEHNLAWRGWIETLTRDPTANGFESPDSITTTFYEASEAADEALTPGPLHGNRERVEAIFASIR